jgi:hypothetical protein
MSEMTAGHRFVDTPAGETCANCGTRWLDLVAKRDQWRPGECGIAHQGFLTQSEVDELNAKLGRVWRAVEVVASARGVPSIDSLTRHLCGLNHAAMHGPVPGHPEVPSR